jgi:transcriptional regulator with XRE-family HTH domain
MFDNNKPRKNSPKKATPIALAIKTARVDAGMTQQALADFTGIGIKVIRNLEQGHVHVNLDRLQSILDFLGLEILILPRDEAGQYRDRHA